MNFKTRILVYHEKNVYKTRNNLLLLRANAGRAAWATTIFLDNYS